MARKVVEPNDTYGIAPYPPRGRGRTVVRPYPLDQDDVVERIKLQDNLWSGEWRLGGILSGPRPRG